MFLDISKGFLYSDQKQSFQAEVELEHQVVFGEEIRFEPVKIEGSYQVTAQDTVIMEGHLETKAHAPCALCTEDVVFPMSFDFHEVFSKTADETEDEEFHYEGKKLPLDHMVLTLCMMELPMRFTCPDGCKDSVEAFLGHEEYRPHPEEETESYYPFAGLEDMLKKS